MVGFHASKALYDALCQSLYELGKAFAGAIPCACLFAWAEVFASANPSLPDGRFFYSRKWKIFPERELPSRSGVSLESKGR